MGNSEVGHLTLGCGSVLRQDLVRINDAVEDHSIATNAALTGALHRAKARSCPLHLIGLVSDGGIHSHIDHLIAMLRVAADSGVVPLLHMITDGRDTAPECATRFVQQLQPVLSACGGSIASICGRYFAMDRDNRWSRVERAWRLLRHGEGVASATARTGIEQAWRNGQSDEFIEPIVLPEFQPIEADDQVLFFNFRNDRPRELCMALSLEQFDGFDRDVPPVRDLTTLTRYDRDYPFAVMFEKEVPAVTLGEVVAEHGLAQLRAAETEKYPHVTFFFSGGREQPFAGEERLLIDSPDVETYDLQPQMSAAGITEGVVTALQSKRFALLVVNYANGDMVGHTGVPAAVIEAMEVVDESVGKLCECAVKNGYSVVLTADHGNADMLVDPVTGTPHTKHTTFPVACTVIDKQAWRLNNGAGLPAIAPTILQLLGLRQPQQMTGESLLLEALE